MSRLNKEQIKEILTEAKKLSQSDRDQLFFRLGVTEYYKDKSKNVKAKADYLGIGLAIFNDLIPIIKKILCDGHEQRKGLKRTAALATLVSILAAHIPAGSIAAVIALILQMGGDEICSAKPKRKKISRRSKK